MKLLVPYIILSIVALLPKYMIQSFLNDSVSFDFTSLVTVFFVPRDNIWGHFWFLPMIFLLGLFGLMFNKILVKCNISLKKGWAVLTLLLILLNIFSYKHHISGWFSIDDIFSLGWAFGLGALSACFNSIEKMPKRNGLIFSFVAFIISISLFILPILNSLSSIKLLVIALLMIYSLTQLCVCGSDKIAIKTNSAYAQTFTIFILSWPFQAVVNVAMESILHMPYWIIMPVQFFAGVIGPIIAILLIDKIEQRLRINWISIALGK